MGVYYSLSRVLPPIRHSPIAKLDTAAGLGESDKGKQGRRHECEKDSHGATS